MTHLILMRLILVCATLLIRSAVPVAALALLSEAGSHPSLAQSLPVPLTVDSSVVLLKAQASGVQIYTCKAKDAPTKAKDVSTKAKDAPTYVWIFKAPEADLVGSDGADIGRHYAGPTWEATDGSKVVGGQIASAASPGNIPWLLLAAKSTAGRGRFSKVTYVERVYTSGGTAPKAGADAAHAGMEVRVPYTATYIFYGHA